MLIDQREINLIFIVGAQSHRWQGLALDFGVETDSFDAVAALQRELHGEGNVRENRRVFRHV